VFASVIVPLALLLWGGGSLLYKQVAGLADALPEWWAEFKATAPERFPQLAEVWDKYGLGRRLDEIIATHGQQFLDALSGIGSAMYAAGAGTVNRVAGMLGWLVLPVYLAFLLRAPTPSINTLEDALPFLKPETRRDVTYLVREFVTILITFFRGQLLIAVIQGAMYAVGFGLIGLRYGVVLGFVLGCLNIVPYLGSMLTLAITLPLALFQAGGGWTMVVLVLAILTITQMVEQYVLTPRIMGDRTGLHPLVIIVSIFFWGSALNGIMGMILAIPLTAFFAVLWSLLKAKYIREII
jgi:predicted PurR-regulated permease PerM